jgi:hypothetical protein
MVSHPSNSGGSGPPLRGSNANSGWLQRSHSQPTTIGSLPPHDAPSARSSDPTSAVPAIAGGVMT